LIRWAAATNGFASTTRQKNLIARSLSIDRHQSHLRQHRTFIADLHL
jgi:hypothetical protein